MADEVTVTVAPEPEAAATDATTAATLQLAAAAGASVEASNQAATEAEQAGQRAGAAEAIALAAATETTHLREEVSRLTAALEANNAELANLRNAVVVAVEPAAEVTELEVEPTQQAPAKPPEPKGPTGLLGRLFLG